MEALFRTRARRNGALRIPRTLASKPAQGVVFQEAVAGEPIGRDRTSRLFAELATHAGAALAAASREETMVPSHGDFKYDQFLRGGAGLRQPPQVGLTTPQPPSAHSISARSAPRQRLRIQDRQGIVAPQDLHLERDHEDLTELSPRECGARWCTFQPVGRIPSTPAMSDDIVLSTLLEDMASQPRYPGGIPVPVMRPRGGDCCYPAWCQACGQAVPAPLISGHLSNS